MTFLAGCDNDMPCKDCANHIVKSNFKNQYFKLLLNSNAEPQLFEFDTITNITGNNYGFCDFISTNEFLTKEVIKASGDKLWACNNIDSFIYVQAYKDVDICWSDPPSLSGNFNLKDRNWLVSKLVYKNFNYLPPCGYKPSIIFNSDGFYRMSEVINSAESNYTIKGTDSLYLRTGSISLTLARTKYQQTFERIMDTLLNRVDPYPIESGFQFNQTNNILVITSNRGKIYFFCQQ